MFLIKRLFDLVVSSLLLVILSPLLCFIAAAIAATMGRPVLFRQKRPGLHKKTFHIIKFRSMIDCRDEHGQLLPDCERETPLGRILRNWSFDELPQLVNVIRGDMSLVGPRPLIERYVNNCSDCHLKRFDVRPGITGLAQVSGRKALDYTSRFELDAWYVMHYSLWLDLKILLATPGTVLRRYGCQEIADTLLVDSKEPVEMNSLQSHSVLIDSETTLIGVEDKRRNAELVDAKKK